jgi:hypothetical protein
MLRKYKNLFQNNHLLTGLNGKFTAQGHTVSPAGASYGSSPRFYLLKKKKKRVFFSPTKL